MAGIEEFLGKNEIEYEVDDDLFKINFKYSEKAEPLSLPEGAEVENLIPESGETE